MQNDTHKTMLPLFNILFMLWAAQMYQAAQHLITFIVQGYYKSIYMEFKICFQARDNRQCQEQNVGQEISLKIQTFDEILVGMEQQYLRGYQVEEPLPQDNFRPQKRQDFFQDPAIGEIPIVEQGQQNQRMNIEAHQDQQQMQEQRVNNSESEGENQADNAQQRQPATLAQKISSTTSTQICNLLSKDKYQKKVVKQIYKQFLDENCTVNSQLVLIFSYLFLLKNSAKENAYVEFKNKLLNYLEKRLIISDSIQDPEVRNSLKFKINIQKQLLNLLFGLRGKFIPNFNELKELVAPLFRKKQVNLPQKPFEEAQKIQEEIVASRYFIYSKAQKTSTGVQVDFE